jgi:hypothetical protein
LRKHGIDCGAHHGGTWLGHHEAFSNWCNGIMDGKNKQYLLSSRWSSVENEHVTLAEVDDVIAWFKRVVLCFCNCLFSLARTKTGLYHGWCVQEFNSMR